VAARDGEEHEPVGRSCPGRRRCSSAPTTSGRRRSGRCRSARS
jgi:hypothetical protein